MNVHATSFVPARLQMERLLKMPFFEQRFQKFIYATFRIDGVTVADLQIVGHTDAIQDIAPTQKRTVIFLGLFRGYAIVYEADRMEDPRTGAFRMFIRSP